MRDFHSTTDWPSILNPQPHQFPLTGASVLEWTMLQPYSNESWRSTYAWTKELDLSRTPFYSTSMALWNLQSRHSQLRSRSNAHDQVRRYKQNPPTTGLKTPAIGQDAFNKGTIRSSLQPTAGLTPTQPSTPVSDTSNKVTMAELLRRGLMDYWFPLRNANSSDGEPDIPILPLTPAAISQWNHPVPIGRKKLAKCMTSFRRWITAIIRQCWATAWDLLNIGTRRSPSKGMACLLPRTGAALVIVHGPSTQPSTSPAVEHSAQSPQFVAPVILTPSAATPRWEYGNSSSPGLLT